MTNLDSLIFIIPAIITLQIGVFIYLAGRRRYLNRVFLLLSLLIVLWEMEGVFCELGVAQTPLVRAGGVLLPVTFLQFVVALTGRSTLLTRALIYVGYLWAAALIFVGISPLSVLLVLFQGSLLSVSIYAIFAYLAYFLFYTVLAIYYLVVSFVKSRDFSRRWRYLLVALAALAAIFSGALRSLPLRTYPIFLISGGFSLVYTLVMGWAIWRYEVLQVSRTLRSGSVYSLVFTIMLLIYLVVAQSLGILVHNYLGWGSNLVGLVVTLIIGPSFYPLREFVDSRLKDFFPASYEVYQSEIRKFSRELANLIPLEELAAKILRFISHVFEIDQAELVVFTSQGTLKSWRLVGSANQISVSENSWGTPGFCEGTGKAVIITLNSRDHIVGWLKLGQSVRGELSKDELELLDSFAAQAGTALHNARLYSELASLTQHYEALLAGTLNGIMVMDDQLKIVTINRVAGSLLGVNPSQAKGKKLVELPGTAGLEKIAQNLMVTGRPLRAQETRVGPLDKQVPVKVDASFTTPPADGEPSVILVLTDLTEQKKVEEQLRRAERLAAMGRLTAGLAHELRNGLNKIGGYALILDDLTKDQPELSYYAKGIQEDVQDLANFLNKFLMFARERTYELTRVSIVKVLQSNLAVLRKEAGQAKIIIEEDYRAEPCVPGDAHQLGMAFFNLIINAFQALKEVGGGALTVRVWQAKGQCYVSVEDTGPGIPAEKQEAIFDPFFTTKENGTGLGLPITHKIIKDHNGEITVESKPGKGTVFTVNLPLCTKDTPESREEMNNEAESDHS
ncbi:MAG: PAS domain S-box protein [Firmicutes bacterium]|nr:PAS domain S-box protein [Bacillota bacterium]